jgi:hypothetical protein
MRSLTTTGGLIRGGRGRITATRLTSVHYDTSEQHKDMTTARQERGTNDMKLLTFLPSKDPFDTDATLHSICTGVTASDSVRVLGRRSWMIWFVTQSVGLCIQEESAGSYACCKLIREYRHQDCLHRPAIAIPMSGSCKTCSHTNFAVTHRHCLKPLM